jgi:hypothetical protein
MSDKNQRLFGTEPRSRRYVDEKVGALDDNLFKSDKDFKFVEDSNTYINLDHDKLLDRRSNLLARMNGTSQGVGDAEMALLKMASSDLLERKKELGQTPAEFKRILRDLSNKMIPELVTYGNPGSSPESLKRRESELQNFCNRVCGASDDQLTGMINVLRMNETQLAAEEARIQHQKAASAIIYSEITHFSLEQTLALMQQNIDKQKAGIGYNGTGEIDPSVLHEAANASYNIDSSLDRTRQGIYNQDLSVRVFVVRSEDEARKHWGDDWHKMYDGKNVFSITEGPKSHGRSTGFDMVTAQTIIIPESVLRENASALQTAQMERLKLEQGWKHAWYDSPIRGKGCDRVQDIAAYQAEHGAHIDVPTNGGATNGQYVFNGQKSQEVAQSPK